MLAIGLTLILSCLILSCATTQPQVQQGVQEGYVVIKKTTLTDLMRSAEICKSQLNDCLQHQKQMQK